MRFRSELEYYSVGSIPYVVAYGLPLIQIGGTDKGLTFKYVYRLYKCFYLKIENRLTVKNGSRWDFLTRDLEIVSLVYHNDETRALMITFNNLFSDDEDYAKYAVPILFEKAGVLDELASESERLEEG